MTNPYEQVEQLDTQDEEPSVRISNLGADVLRQSSLPNGFMQFGAGTSDSEIAGPMPYRDAIQQIEKIQSCTTPREKLALLTESYRAIKTAVVDFHKGKLELDGGMDDVLPLSIYIVSQAEVSQIASHFKMLEDFIKINE